MGVLHKKFFSGQDKVTALGCGSQSDPSSVIAPARLSHGQREEEIPGCHCGQERGLLRRRATGQDRCAPEQHGGEERPRQQGLAHLFQNHHQIEKIAPAAAVFFGDNDTEPAELGDFFP